MGVTVTIHFPVSDVAKAIEGLRSNAKFLEEITESTRGAGMLHHRFVPGASIDPNTVISRLSWLQSARAGRIATR
jgi:hypothetical protein